MNGHEYTGIYITSYLSVYVWYMVYGAWCMVHYLPNSFPVTIPPLVSATKLQPDPVAVAEIQEVVGLDYLVVECKEGGGRFAGEELFDGLGDNHAVDTHPE